MVDRDRLTCFITYVIVYKGLTGGVGYSIVLSTPGYAWRHVLDQGCPPRRVLIVGAVSFPSATSTQGYLDRRPRACQ